MSVRIDVVMCTYNSMKRGLLPLVLKAIKNYIPLNKLIIVDKYSDDGTLELIKRYFPDNSVVIRTYSNIAYARYIGIKLVETELFAFIDDDAIVLPYWWQVLSKYMVPKIGAVEGSCIQLPDIRGELRDFLARNTAPIKLTKRLSIKQITKGDVILRGLNPVRSVLSNVVIRKEAVIDWRPPIKASAYEDYLITQHVINKGFYWVVINKPVALHGTPPKDKFSKIHSSIRKGLWEGAGIKHAGIPVNFIILYSLSRLGGAIIKLFKNKDIYDITMRLAFLLSLPSDKYLSPKR
uniref:Glycosyltransferase family 2 protein n=1 Tax=Ignisphaera aggregans TaxID=334771 RepID=A0A7J3YTX9_9CREN